MALLARSFESKVAFIEAVRAQTKGLALRVIALHRELPVSEESRVIGRQLLRSATSVAANYRAVSRARSAAEHLAKLSICVEEADETLFWLELLVEAQLVPLHRLSSLCDDYDQIIAILATARKTAKAAKNPST
ncbi:MAG TPA: four helix bundle protein [Hymenobacter sp.]|uniref:four helix bundle protein n=1 Tax=Hymenobacter sp. TaxID=1898978 RepID=UPI002D7E3BD7|nr:four helix bundle protein [Hymenobacter sp.]HET9503552.1 four helix bundle protein [Hymenobacter sp.]